MILDKFANTAPTGSIVAFYRHNANLLCGDVEVICYFGDGYAFGRVVVKQL